MPRPGRRQLLLAAPVALIIVALLAWRAITHGGAAVIALQVLAMCTAAYGPLLALGWLQRRRR